MSSPSLSVTTALTSKTTTESTKSATSAISYSGVNFAELFEDINWNDVNLIELESEWHAELGLIERVHFERQNYLFILRKMYKRSWIAPARRKWFFQQ